MTKIRESDLRVLLRMAYHEGHHVFATALRCATEPELEIPPRICDDDSLIDLVTEVQRFTTQEA